MNAIKMFLWTVCGKKGYFTIHGNFQVCSLVSEINPDLYTRNKKTIREAVGKWKRDCVSVPDTRFTIAFGKRVINSVLEVV